jgi:hypothetical protein
MLTATRPILARRELIRPKLASLMFGIACMLSLAIYVPTLDGFFANDDWVLLAANTGKSLSRPWEFFSPRVVWFYRPLASLTLAVWYQAFGLNPVPYNLLALALHLAVCGLLFLWLSDLTRRPALAAGALLLFVCQSVYSDVVIWKANLNVLQSAALTLGACLSLTRHIRTHNHRWLLASWSCFGASLLTRESSVVTPGLMALAWLASDEFEGIPRGPALVAAGRRAVALLGVPVLLAALYVGLHRAFVVNTYTAEEVGYALVSPTRAAWQLGFAFNHLFFPVVLDQLFLPSLPSLSQALKSLAVNVVVLPLLLPVAAWRWRCHWTALGTAWIVLTLLPTIALKEFHSSRYYYLPVMGASLVAALIAGRLWSWLGGLQPEGTHRLSRRILALAVGLSCLSSLSSLYFWLELNRASSKVAIDAFRTLRAARGQLPAGALVVLRNAPAPHFGWGLGAGEWGQFALGDVGADAVLPGQPVPEARLRALRARPNVYLMDLAQIPIQIQRIPNPIP